MLKRKVFLDRFDLQMMNTCTGLKGSWQGEAASIYYNKLSQIAGDLRDVNNIIDEQRKDLQEISKEYKLAETTTSQAVAGLNTDVLHF